MKRLIVLKLNGEEIWRREFTAADAEPSIQEALRAALEERVLMYGDGEREFEIIDNISNMID